ncbi:MAG TPA: metal-dependent transcriptional regulator [Candidatus Scatovivens faecipullorum]|nr:metal-dependent transcriptional regulator [Candidatus Scatovivens faecipullorum]
MITKSLEEYLKNMYILSIQNGDIRVTDIAKKMNCTKPSVNKALNNLKDNNLINYETYGKIELTKEGENIAKKILEAYDIVFIFLRDVLELNEEDAKNDAEKIKNSVSDNALNKLAKYVHKVLNFNNLDCGYDINKEKCRDCARRKIKKYEK